MANLAEQLRNEIDILKVIPWLKEKVVSRIRTEGRFRIICDTHINEIKEHAVPNRYYAPIERWARSEGFHVSSVYNSYGVRSINIEL